MKANLTDAETEELLSVFKDVSADPLNDRDNQPNLRSLVTPSFSGLMVLFLVTWIFIQYYSLDVIEHYSLIHGVQSSDAQNMITAKATISLIGVLAVGATFLFNKGITMVSFLFLVLLTNSFLDDVSMRIATDGALLNLKMNAILVLRLAMIALTARISYICIMRNKYI